MSALKIRVVSKSLDWEVCIHYVDMFVFTMGGVGQAGGGCGVGGLAGGLAGGENGGAQEGGRLEGCREAGGGQGFFTGEGEGGEGARFLSFCEEGASFSSPNRSISAWNCSYRSSLSFSGSSSVSLPLSDDDAEGGVKMRLAKFFVK